MQCWVRSPTHLDHDFAATNAISCPLSVSCPLKQVKHWGSASFPLIPLDRLPDPPQRFEFCMYKYVFPDLNLES